jgi:putative ABC transport system permease protein
MLNYITFKSLRNRKVTAFLSILSIAMSISLYLGVEQVRRGAEEGFTNTISKADLIIGAKGSPLQLLLYTVFRLGSPINNIRYSTFEEISSNRGVKWAIPISLGDSYKGFRVVGTNESFYKNYQYHGDKNIKLLKGQLPSGIFDVVLGSKVAKRFGHKVGDKIILSHGISEQSVMDHDNSPFKIVGILDSTSTPIDKAVYVTLEGIEAIHIGWETGVPDEENMADPATLVKEKIEIKQITSMIVGLHNRIFTLHLKNWVDNFEGEPIMAVIPALALQELWTTVGYVEQALSLVSICVLVVGLLGIIISLYTSINERRREMAILRSLGAGAKDIFMLYCYESMLLVVMGCFAGLGLLYGGLLVLRPILEKEFSIFINIAAPTSTEWYFLLIVSGLGLLAGIIPAIKAYRNSLHDGLSINL